MISRPPPRSPFPPLAARQKALTCRKGKRVWILDKDKLKRIDVVSGISDGSYTEMVSGGLTGGMELVVESRAKAGTRKSSSSGSMHGVSY